MCETKSGVRGGIIPNPDYVDVRKRGQSPTISHNYTWRKSGRSVEEEEEEEEEEDDHHTEGSRQNI